MHSTTALATAAAICMFALVFGSSTSSPGAPMPLSTKGMYVRQPCNEESPLLNANYCFKAALNCSSQTTQEGCESFIWQDACGNEAGKVAGGMANPNTTTLTQCTGTFLEGECYWYAPPEEEPTIQCFRLYENPEPTQHTCGTKVIIGAGRKLNGLLESEGLKR